MPHTVRLTDRPISFQVDDGESILAAGLRAGLTLPFGCQSGGCGSCRVRKAEGEVRHVSEPAALSDAEREAGYVLMCVAEPCTDVALELHQPLEMDAIRPRKLPVRVARREMLSPDVLGLWLQTPPVNPLNWVPGQYIDVLLDGGRRRSFSIANAPAGDGMLELHLRHVAGGEFVEWAMHEMPERAMLRIEGPLGAFYLREDSDRPILLMAGGTGYAPARAILQRYLARRITRPLHFYWGARGRADLYQHDEIRAWADEHPSLDYTPVLSEPDPDWDGATGFVHEAVLRDYPDQRVREVYMSGPPPMVQAGKRAFVAAGLDADHLFYDSFDYAFETWPALEAGHRGAAPD